MAFDNQPVLTGETVQLRPLLADDFDALLLAAGDPKIWAGHPDKERYKPEKFHPYFDFLLSAGGSLVVLDRTSDNIIGCSRYYVPPEAPDEIAVGFTFLEINYWGGETNFEMKQLMFDHAFKTFPTMWLHIAPNNIRSQKATAKLGAEHVGDQEMDLGTGKRMTQSWRLPIDCWENVKAARRLV